jgi:septal ring-binding cell division protein DamX
VKITIKQIQGVLLSNLMLLGLAACSSSPSPWSQQDDSPWKAKRDAEVVAAPVDEFVEVSLDELAPIAEPVFEPEPVAILEPEPVFEPEPASAGNDIMALPASSFAVQVYAGGSEESVDRYQAAHGLQDLWTVKTDRDGAAIYVLVSVHDDRASANQAAVDLEQKTGSRPWVRSMAGLQKIVVQ